MKYVVKINNTQLTAVKINAFVAGMRPAGMSLCFVLGFSASKFRSRKRLKAMAAFLANTIHAIMKTSFIQLNVFSVVLRARKKPMKAKGIANMVWAKSTSERYFFIFFEIDVR